MTYILAYFWSFLPPVTHRLVALCARKSTNRKVGAMLKFRNLKTKSHIKNALFDMFNLKK